MALLTARSSTIFIARGGETRVYRSLDDVPAPLQRELRESTRGVNSATILIADKRGRQELARALRRRPGAIQCRLADTVRETQDPPEPPKRLPLRSWRTWLELLLPLALGASLWAFIEARF